jgi:hypothetical protein
VDVLCLLQICNPLPSSWKTSNSGNLQWKYF